MEINRDRYLNALIESKHNGFIKVITGIRRCGKSYLMNVLFYNHLISEGIPEDHIIRFAFDSADDVELLGIDYLKMIKRGGKVDPFEFVKYFKEKISGGGEYYLLLDEVQNLDGFEAVLNGYLRKENLDVYVTGSNSKFLSKDVITEFAGRGDEIHVFPLSYSEYHNFKGDSEEDSLESYMVYGGLPAVALMNNSEKKEDYLRTQMDNIYLRDIVNRYRLSKEDVLGELTDVLASGMSTLVNPLKISNTFKTVKNSKLSASTVKNYLGYMEEAYLIKCAKRYDVKGRKHIGTPYKVYFEDVGLRNARLDFRQIEESHLMENIIFNELRYRGYNVDVGVVNTSEYVEGKLTRKQYEVDFVANKGSRRYYIQSAYDIYYEEKMIQETNSFRKIPDSFKKIIIVKHLIIPRRDNNGYVMIGLKQFLLDENSLEL